MNLSQNQVKAFVVLFPIAFSFLYAFFCYLFTVLNPSVFTADLHQELQTDSAQVFWTSLLILLPNIFLSLIMYFYSNSYTAESLGQLLLIPCLAAIAVGSLLVLYCYYFFYIQQTTEMPVAVLAFGFPFVYFLGMMVGWVIGILVMSSIKKT